MLKKTLLSLVCSITFSLFTYGSVWAVCNVNNPPTAGESVPFPVTIESATPGLTYELSIYRGTSLVENKTARATSNKVSLTVGGYARGFYSFLVTAKDGGGPIKDNCTSSSPTEVTGTGTGDQYRCLNPFTPSARCAKDPTGAYPSENACKASCLTGSPTPAPADPCNGLKGPEYDICKKCIVTDNGAWTALGCISTDPGGFINWLLPKAIGVAGGIAFLLILMGGFQILTSSGEPEKLNEGKDIVVSAIVGLLMIIFSIILLRIIGYDILQIPGFLSK